MKRLTWSFPLFFLANTMVVSSMDMKQPSFSGYNRVAKDYDKGRIDYPPESIALLVKTLGLNSKKAVLDLGAGTGKLTKALSKADIRLSAVEPVEEMRLIFAEKFPTVPILSGKAEQIPLPDASQDVVLVGTAFHWFEGKQALNEIARILKANGSLGLIWNIFDGDLPWVQKIRTLLEAPYGKGGLNLSKEWHKWQQPFHDHPSFSTLEHQTFIFSYRGTVQDVLDRVSSAKIMGTLTETEKKQLMQKVLDILASDPATQGKEVFDIPYRTEVYWSFRKSS